ncbi:MAG: hypothetical protein U0X91_19035 [Spirosomataceae bacterium]
MRQITIQLPDQQYEFFMQLVRNMLLFCLLYDVIQNFFCHPVKGLLKG